MSKPWQVHGKSVGLVGVGLPALLAGPHLDTADAHGLQTDQYQQVVNIYQNHQINDTSVFINNTSVSMSINDT